MQQPTEQTKQFRKHILRELEKYGSRGATPTELCGTKDETVRARWRYNLGKMADVGLVVRMPREARSNVQATTESPYRVLEMQHAPGWGHVIWEQARANP